MAGQTPKPAPIDAEPLLKPTELSHHSLKSLIQAAEANGFKLIDWERVGTPSIDKVVLTITGPTEKSGDLLNSVLKVNQIRPQMRVFPRGIIDFDHVQVEISAVSGR